MKTNKMETYKVKKEDLIGQLDGFPIEVVQAMVDEQVKQGNGADVTVFQYEKTSDNFEGGFNWHKADKGTNFWKSVILKEDFEIFFGKNQIQNEPNQLKYCNLYHNNATMQFKTGEHTYSDSESAYENRKENSADGYRYFTTIECSIKE